MPRHNIIPAKMILGEHPAILGDPTCTKTSDLRGTACINETQFLLKTQLVLDILWPRYYEPKFTLLYL